MPRHALSPPPAGGWLTAVAVGVVALVFAHWGLTAKDALGRGIFNFDSLWYHLPFAVEMAQSHSVTGLHYTETVFTNWFYPQNGELLHAVGILLTGRDTLCLFLNFGWLAIAFLAAWCIGRPYGRGPLTVVAAGVLLECHTLVVREPGAAKNDLMAAALLLAAIAILVNADGERWRGRVGGGRLPAGRPVAGRTGLAVGTKSTALAMAAALTVAVIVLGPCWAPLGRRWLVVRCGSGGRRLLVPAQPRHLPATRCPSWSTWGRSRCLTRSGCRKAGPTSASSTTRPTPASGASTSSRACTRLSAPSGRWSSPPPSPAA